MPETRHAFEPEEIMAYLDGELDAGRAAEAMTHLDRCPECQRLAGDLRRVSRELTAWQVEATDQTAPVMGATKAPQRRTWTFRPAWAVAATLAAVVLVFLWTSRDRAGRQVGVMLRTPMAKTTPAIRQAEPLMPPSPVPQAADQTEVAALGPMIERTATLTVTTHDFDGLRARIDAILARRHGYVADLTANAPDKAGRTLNASLRIPAAELGAALTELKLLGHVESESQNGRDVSSEYVDLVARLSNARNTAQRLTQLLAQRTGKLDDVLAVENELSRVQGQIERMEAERKNTEARVAYATVQLNVSEYYKAQLQSAPDSTLIRFRNAGVEGYRSLADTVIDIALLVIADGPTLLLWAALLFFPVRAIWRRVHRHEP